MKITNKSDNETNMSESKTKRNNNRTDRGANRRAGNTPELTAEQQRTELAKQLGLKPKSKAVLDELIDNPKLTPADAYLKHHNTTNRQTAHTAMSKLLKKPSAIGYKDSAVGKAKRRIVTLVNSDNESIALKASQDIIDRNEGKAIQKSENTNRTIHVSLDVQGLRMASHYIEPTNTPSIE